MTTDDRHDISPFKQGIRFGLGFSIPFLILYVFAWTIAAFCTRYIQENMFERAMPETFGADSGLTISRHELVADRPGFVIRGRVVNQGSNAWDYIRLQFDLKNTKDEFLGLCEGRVNGVLHPGRERHFEVSCDESVLVGIDAKPEYDIELVDALHEKTVDSDD